MSASNEKLICVLDSFCAEGTPVLALQLSRYWIARGADIQLVRLNHHPDDLLTEFTALGIPIHTFRLGKGLMRYPRLFWQTFRLCRRARCTAVLSFPLGWHAFIAWGAKLAGVPRTCAHVGNLPPVWTGTAFLKFKALVQLGRRATHRLLCCSEYIREATIADFQVSPQETRTIYNACDLDRFLPQKPRARGGVHTPLRIAMVARLEAHKDQPTLIEAVALLRDRGIAVEAWLIGEGSRRTALKALINGLHLSGQVKLLGMRRDIPDLLQELDVFVFAAKPDEGFGIALAEAMAAGVPIVATDVGACREVLNEGSCGLLVPAQNPQALADGILAVRNDPGAALSRATAASDRVCQHFSVAAMARAYGHELGFDAA
jgi:glycosyltransferase involved in cell wall biosynthesis